MTAKHDAKSVWADLSESERTQIALETTHLPRAYLLLQALDRELAVPAVESYEEWRVTGTWEDEPYQFTWSPTRGDDHPEFDARNFVTAMRENIHWSDGPHLHRRRVTVTEWEAMEP